MARRARPSQKERLQRLRAEKEAAVKKPGKKKAAKKKSARKTTKKKPASKKGRKVMVWAVFDQAYKQVATFAYKEKKEAEAHCSKLTKDKKKPHVVRAVKQDMV